MAENIRIVDLPDEASPVAGEFVAIDGASTRKTTLEQFVNAGRPLASQAEAEGGTQATKAMTALTTRQAIDFRLPSTSLGRSLLNGASQAAIRAAIDAQQQFESLDAIGALTPAADRFPYFTDDTTAALGTLTSYARTLLDDADAATAQQTLELEPGVDVQGYEPILQEFADLTLGTEGQVLAVGAGSALAWTDAGTGDMVASTYDPDNKATNAFDSANTDAPLFGVQRSVADVLSKDISVSALGFVEVGDTGIEQAINRAIDFVFARAGGVGGEVTLPNLGGEYDLTGKITLKSNVTVRGLGKPSLSFIDTSQATIVDFSNCGGSVFTGFAVDGMASTALTGRAVNMSAAQFCELSNVDFVDLKGVTNGAIYLDVGARGNVLERLTSVDCGNTFIGLIGSGVNGNFVRHVEVTDCLGFGVFVAGGAYGNEIAFCRTTSNDLELVGITALCEKNRIIGNHAEGCGDNGISVTGRRNTVVGNTCVYNWLSGIFLYGSYNTCTGNICVGNNQSGGTSAGITIQAVFGGTGQYNTVVGNTCDDDQAVLTQNNSIRVISKSYSNWAAGVVTTVGTYIVNGLNIYRAATAGTTGATAPTHTSGTVSDGAVDWTYFDSFISVAETDNNTVLSNNHGRSIGASVFFSPSIQNTIRLFSGSSSQSALYFNDGADAGWLRYDHSTNTMEIGAGAVTLMTFNVNRAIFNRGIQMTRTGAGANYTVLATDHTIGVSSTAAPRTITLPAAGRVQGQRYEIKDESGGAGTNNITVSGNGANIDGASTYVINTNYGSVTVYWTGSAWAILAKA